MDPSSLTRNFCIIAHVDLGKTTLSDRLLEHTNTVSMRNMTAQHLDSMDLEKERGITIKSHPVTMTYPAKDGLIYKLNLMDTPGHVDFSYEVSRSLAACEGAVLLIDAAQGVEAQTVANAHLAFAQKLKVIPVINKIDLPSANLELCLRQLEDILTISADEAILASGQVRHRHRGYPSGGRGCLACRRRAGTDYPQTRALVFDSLYDTYRGVIAYARVFSGAIKAGDTMMLMSTGQKAEVKEVWCLHAEDGRRCPSLGPSRLMWATSFPASRITSEIKTGDTVTPRQKPGRPPRCCRVTRRSVRWYFAASTRSTPPITRSSRPRGRPPAAERPAAFVYQQETSVALGFGFRCGFLGLLHMEIIQERIRREHDVDIISTYPSVIYRVTKHGGEEFEVDNPINLPDPGTIIEIREPTIKAAIHIPNEAMGDMLALVMEKRGTLEHTDTLDATRVMLTCLLPLNEVLVDFNDRLKSLTHGYGSMDYELGDYRPADLVKMEILVNTETVDAFATIVHREKAEGRGRELCERLAKIIPPQMFKVAIQAAIGGKIIARDNVKEMRKDVTSKCYGGDISRKRKLLDKQKEGKKKMKQFGRVSIPSEAFIQVLKND